MPIIVHFATTQRQHGMLYFVVFIAVMLSLVIFITELIIIPVIKRLHSLLDHLRSLSNH